MWTKDCARLTVEENETHGGEGVNQLEVREHWAKGEGGGVEAREKDCLCGAAPPRDVKGQVRGGRLWGHK